MNSVPPYQSVSGKPICTKHRRIHDGQCLECAVELLGQARIRLVGSDELAIMIDEFLSLPNRYTKCGGIIETTPNPLLPL